MRDIIFTLSTQGWEKALEEEDNLETVERLVEIFTIPLEGAVANTAEIHTELWRLFMPLMPLSGETLCFLYSLFSPS